MRFWHPDLAAEPARLAVYATTLQASPGATFMLICRRRRLGHNSWLHGAVHDGDTDGAAWLAPTDMMALGVPEGGDVLLHTTGATLQMPAVPVRGVSPGTVVVPHGVEHRPVADEEVEVLLFEPAGTLNTGNVRNERTVTDPARL